MKTKFLLFFPGLAISINSFCQDSTSLKNNTEIQNQQQLPTTMNPVQQSQPNNQPIYRDTRLGSSSPQYNTYQKNQYGAGGVTTDYYKSQGGGIPENIAAQHYFDTTHPSYRDTRLGSSSPNYNTYEKNNYGAGAVTTNPNKGQGGVPVFAPATSEILSTTDSLRKY